MILKISKRLEAVAGLVSPGKRLADIGTDHGYIPLALLMEGKIPSAVAMDINAGPLRQAEENVKKYGYCDKVILRLSDGLEKLEDGTADAIVIAGMGGPLMTHILSNGRKKIKADTELILQPQSEIAAFRHFLHNEGYKITCETFVYDEGKYYTAMKAVKGSQRFFSEMEYHFGKYLLDEKNSVLYKYLIREQQKYGYILKRIDKKSPLQSERFYEIEAYLTDIKAALDLFGTGGDIYER